MAFWLSSLCCLWFFVVCFVVGVLLFVWLLSVADVGFVWAFSLRSE